MTGLWGIRRSRVVKGAEWHGKLTTVAIYTMILVHLVWADIPPAVSTILVGACMGIMLMSLVLYAIRNAANPEPAISLKNPLKVLLYGRAFHPGRPG